MKNVIEVLGAAIEAAMIVLVVGIFFGGLFL